MSSHSLEQKWAYSCSLGAIWAFESYVLGANLSECSPVRRRLWCVAVYLGLASNLVWSLAHRPVSSWLRKDGRSHNPRVHPLKKGAVLLIRHQINCDAPPEVHLICSQHPLPRFQQLNAIRHQQICHNDEIIHRHCIFFSNLSLVYVFIFSTYIHYTSNLTLFLLWRLRAEVFKAAAWPEVPAYRLTVRLTGS